MGTIRLARRTLLGFSALASISAAIALWTVSMVSALLLGLALLALTATIALNMRVDARQRARLQRDLDRRMKAMESLLHMDRKSREMGREPLRAIDIYRHQAQTLHRIAGVERKLGIESGLSSDIDYSKAEQ